MAKRVLLPALLAIASCGAIATAAAAKGIETGVSATDGGVTVSGSPYRYTAFSPTTVDKHITVVARTDSRDGRINRWWHLRGTYYLPAVAYDRSPGGLSADGSTLVLDRFAWSIPPDETRLAILDTGFRHPRRPGQNRRRRHAITRIDLKGDFSFDAISPDGSTIYLIHRYLPPRSGGAYLTNYEVRALDTETGKLLPGKIVDPDEPDERMAGLPITRASSPDGRWAYTLYDGDGHEPFIHALDTVGGVAVCIDLPQLEKRRNLFMLGLRTEQEGRELSVLTRPLGDRRSRPLLTVDTASFEVREASSSEPESGVSWLPIGIAAAALVAAIAWIAQRRRGGRPDEQLGRA